MQSVEVAYELRDCCDYYIGFPAENPGPGAAYDSCLLYTSANQGWKDKHHALDMIHWLHEKGIVMIEQPMPKEQLDDIAG